MKRPAWILSLVLASALTSLMPAANLAVFGIERLQALAVTDAERVVHGRLSEPMINLVTRQVTLANEPGAVGVLFVITILSIILGGLGLVIGAMLVDVTLIPAQALRIAALSTIVVVLGRIFAWTTAIVLLGRDVAAETSWKAVATSDLSVLATESTGVVMKTLLHSVDLLSLVGIVVSALLLSTVPRMNAPAAIFASSFWWIISVLLTITAAMTLNVAI